MDLTLPDFGLDPEVSTEAFEADPVLTKYQTETQQAYWQAEVEAHRKERKEFDEKARKTIAKYADERNDGDQGRANFNVFFANTEIKAAAVFAKIPVPDIKRRFDDASDDVSRVASNIIQRNITYELECGDFDSKIKNIIWDRLVPGFGVGWLRLEQEHSEGTPEVPGTPLTHPQTGQPLLHPETGEQLTSAPIPAVEPIVLYEQAEIDYVPWDKFLWAPCRSWPECRWVGRAVPMSKDAIKERFGSTCPDEVINALSFSENKTDRDSKDELKPKNVTQLTVDVLELWDKERGLVFWIADGATVPLDVQQDTNEFDGFFPTPLPPLGRYTTSNTLPLSDYRMVQAQYRELDDLNNRCSKLTQALQLRWVYDAANGPLADLYKTGGELQGIPVKDWAVQMSEKGGLKGAIEFAPLDEIASTYQKLSMARDVVKAQIYEIEGISDFMRGVAQPYVPNGTAQATAQTGAGRLQVMQHNTADYIQRLLRLKAHLICKFYSPDTMMQRAGSMNPADQQWIQPALALLKQEQMAHFRLSVSVDSIQLDTWQREGQERGQVMSVITPFMQNVLPMLKQEPDMGPIAFAFLKYAVAGMKGSQEIGGVIDQASQQFEQKMAMTQGQPPQPSPDQLKAQSAMQVAQIAAQAKANQTASAERIASMQAQLDAQKLQIDAINAQTKKDKLNADIAHSAASIHIDALDGAHRTASDVAALGGF